MVFNLLLSICTLCTLHPSEKGVIPEPVQNDSLTVYVFLLDECLISQYFTPELTRLYDRYKQKGVGFIGYFPNTTSTEEAIADFAKKYHLDFPLNTDYDRQFVDRFGITVTPEVAVWDHQRQQLLYRGRIDDSYVRVGKRKLHPRTHDLENSIDHWLAGESSDQLIETQAIGCFINFDTSRQ